VVGFDSEEDVALWSAAVVGGHRMGPSLLKCATGQKADDGIACENVYLGAGGKTIHGGCLESWSVREAGRGKGLDMISGSLLL
jgi:hypothetical protein